MSSMPGRYEGDGLVMKRKIFFCKSWFRAKKRPTEIWSEQQATAANDDGLPYTVLVDSVERPYCFLEVTRKSIGMGFLDEALRESLTYGFQEVEPGKLFLTMATYRDFVDGTDKVARGTSYIFGRDGTVAIRRESFLPEHDLETSSTMLDVAKNYCAMPSFGEYDDLIRVDRS
jgi:hypothetical protein